MARTALASADDQDLGPNGRPQVLAQLAKDISDLIRQARSPAEAKSTSSRPPAWRPSSPRPVQEAPAEQETPTFLVGAGSLDAVNNSVDAEYQAARASRAQAQEVRCPSCGQFNPSDANFCRHCGRRLAAITPAAAAPEDHFSFSLGSSAAAAPARGRPEMSDLLADLETREAALRAKVQQLTDEKSLREKRLEDELEQLRRTNRRLEEELRQKAVPVVTQPPELTFGAQLQTRTLGPVAERTSRPAVTQDLRDDLQQQLQEIREEVTRCARALQEQESIPPAEVQDIRQQLQAMSEEVHQTSRALPAPESELDEVRRQLDVLQRQVSSALNTALARPAEPIPTSAAQPANGFGRGHLHSQGLFPPEGASQWPRARPPARLNRSSELSGALEQLDSLRQNLCANPVHTSGLAPEVAALHGRLTAIRAEVARVLQESQTCEASAEPVLQTQLRVLLSELSDVRCAAAAVAQAAAGGGPPRHSALPWQRFQAEPLTEVQSNPPTGTATPELRAAGKLVTPMYVCQHLAPDLTFGPEAVSDGRFAGRFGTGSAQAPLSRPSSASGSRTTEGPGSFASRAPEEPVDRAPQHALRRPSRSKLSFGEGWAMSQT